MEFVVQLPLFDERQNLDAPTQQRLAILTVNRVGRERLFRIVEQLQCKADLSQVVERLSALSCFTSGLCRGQQKSRQRADRRHGRNLLLWRTAGVEVEERELGTVASWHKRLR